MSPRVHSALRDEHCSEGLGAETAAGWAGAHPACVALASSTTKTETAHPPLGTQGLRQEDQELKVMFS